MTPRRPSDLLSPDLPAPLATALRAAAARHDHLCPRQVLGARIGLFGGARLGLDLPRADKRLIVIVEADGCFCDGVAAATGCEVGRRTLRVEDYGKIAATFADAQTGRAIRIRPRLDVRHQVQTHAPEAESRWHAYVLAYQTMPDDDLLEAERVVLVTPVERLISHARHRAICAECGEEVSNEREIVVDGRALCRSCAAQRGDGPAGAGAYYRSEDQGTGPSRS